MVVYKIQNYENITCPQKLSEHFKSATHSNLYTYTHVPWNGRSISAPNAVSIAVGRSYCINKVCFTLNQQKKQQRSRWTLVLLS